jgi:aldehyde:ferredoxin oxidoreductase
MSASMLGDILFVDLTNRKTTKRPFTKEMASQYIGCRGYNAALLWEMVPKAWP